jgi:hypothetical protein
LGLGASEILTMMEEGDAYENWRTYGTWKDMDGRPLAETALASDKEREDRMKQKRPTLPLTNVSFPTLHYISP